MRINNLNRRGGFFKAIILIIVALAILNFAFKISPNDILKSDFVSNLWSIIKTVFGLIWTAILLILDFIKEILITAKNFLEGLNQ